MKNIKKLSFTVVILAVLICLSACGRGNDEIENTDVYVAEEPAAVNEVTEPETPEAKEPTTDTVETGTAPEEPAAPNYIWEVWTLSHVDVDGWKEDIEQFRNIVFRWHPKFADNTLNTLPRNIEMGIAFDERIDQLLENVPNLTKFEILAELQRALTILENNFLQFGARSLLLRGAEETSFLHQLTLYRYLLEFGWFYDGFYLFRAAQSGYAALVLNHRLVAINDTPIENIFTEFQNFWSLDNIYNARSSFAHFLNSPGILYALGVLDGQQTTYTFLGDNQERISISVSESFPNRPPSTLFPFPIDWRLTLDEPLADNRVAGEIPLFLQNQHQNSWYTFIEDYGLLYIRVNIHGFPNTEFISNIIDLLGDVGEDLRATIIDSRTNPGTDGDIFNFFDILVEATPPGKLFYFINEGSLAASISGGGALLYELGATIIGQPSGQSIDFYAGAMPFFLPNSNFSLPLPVGVFTTRNLGFVSEDLIFRPHVLIEYTIDDWMNNHDPYLEYVLNLLR